MAPPESKARLDGTDLLGMFRAALDVLEVNVEAINALNVFPVPDGDTGTNMFLTLREVADKVATFESDSAAEVATSMAQAALMGARGNSGVILSQFFKGIAAGLAGASDFGAEELVTAFQEARERSYKAVGTPVEGTMLTVIDCAAKAASEALGPGASVTDILEAASAAARDCVARTPTMLQVLRDAGVVDAGGQGFLVILEGATGYAKGEAPELRPITVPEPVGLDGTAGFVSMAFVDATEEEVYGYCTQFLVEGQDLDVDDFREKMSSMAQSTVVVGDESMVNVHVHAEDPGAIVSFAVLQGTLSQVKIENMDAQHVEFTAARRREDEAERVGLAVVAVAPGPGFEAVFDNLGASVVVAGGDTMNPSVKDIVNAIERARSENVIVLPNNGNIVPAAVQAGEASSKSVRVVPTTTVPQGIAAILTFNPVRDAEANAAEMEQASSSVRTASVTEAVRAAKLHGVEVAAGRLIGLLERELVVAGNELSDTVLATLKKADVSEGDLVTVYWGDRTTVAEAEQVSTDVTKEFPDAEVELVEGGQPHYHFIMSIE